MAIVEAALLYRPHGFGAEHPVIIGTVEDPGALRIVRDRLWAKARAEAERWRDLDPGIAAMKLGEVERLARVLSILLPDEDLAPELRLVKPTTATEPIEGS